MKFAIVGAGAMGSLMGAYPAIAGHEVWLVDPFKAHMDAIAENGLTILRSPFPNPDDITELHVNMKTAETADGIGTVDVVLLMVKNTFNEAALDNLKKLVGEDSLVVTLQNGMGSVDFLKEHFNPDHIAYGCIAMNGRILEPGKIRSNVVLKDNAYIGSDNPALKDRLEEICAAYEAGGLDVIYKENIKDYVWKKMCGNSAGNAWNAIVRCNVREAYKYQEYADLCWKTMEECVAVAQAMGAHVTLEDVGMPRNSFTGDFNPMPAHYSSTAQDVMKKGKTEIDYLNGYIIKEGKRLGIPTPYNEAAYCVIKTMEGTYPEQF